jgi:hypothetical protein
MNEPPWRQWAITSTTTSTATVSQVSSTLPIAINHVATPDWGASPPLVSELKSEGPHTTTTTL